MVVWVTARSILCRAKATVTSIGSIGWISIVGSNNFILVSRVMMVAWVTPDIS
jgi:hypothetical protein